MAKFRVFRAQFSGNGGPEAEFFLFRDKALGGRGDLASLRCSFFSKLGEEFKLECARH